MARKVSIVRVHGGEHPHVALGSAREGWELVRPTEGERYCLFMESGRIFRSSKVIRVMDDEFETHHSRYALRVLEDLDEASIPSTVPAASSLRPLRPRGKSNQTQEWVRK